MDLLYFLLIGLVAGCLASFILKPAGATLLVNLVIGVIGALVGGFLVQNLNIAVPGGIIGRVGVATGGAIIFLIILKVLRP